MHLFDQDISLQPHSDGRYQTTLTANWLVNDVPNGGYLLALLSHALTRCSGKKSTPILTANYLTTCTPGPAEIDVESVSRSRRFERWQARLIQDGRERVRAFATFGDDPPPESFIRYERLPPDLAPPEDCPVSPPHPRYTLMQQIDLRLDPASAAWRKRHLQHRSEIRGWIKFAVDRPYDMPSVALLSDAFPPAVMASQGSIAWVPTIEISVNIRTLPNSPWLIGRYRTRYISNGLLEEDGELWDQKGALIAVSRQIAQFRRPDRYKPKT